MSYRGIDIREAAGGLLFRAFLQDAVGALLTSGATTLRLYELQTDGTIKSYDFADNTFKTTALTTATLGMTHRTGNNGTVNTGIWSVALTTLTGFTAGMTYFAAVNNTGASPPDQVREFQYGSGVLADMVAVGGTAQTAGDICGKIGTPVDLGNGIATLAGNMSDIDTEADAIIGYVTNIATVGSPTYASSSSFTLTTGNQTSGTYVNTDTANQVYHVITDAAGTLSIIYGFTLRPDEVASTLTWIGRWNGTNDTLLFEIYDWTGTPGYRTWFTQTGVSGTTSASDFTKTLNLVSKYTGTGANIGKVNVRISGTGLTSCTLSTDQLIVGKSNTSQSVGYADGAVWVKATGTSGTTLYFNGTADNPCPWSDAQTIASALGTSRFRILNGETVTLNASTASKSLIGSNWTIALAGQVVSGAYIEGAEVSGTGTSVAQTEFMHCHINAGTTLGPSRFYHCGFSGTSGSKVTAGSAGEFLLIDCFSEVAGSGTPYFTFAGTGGTTGVNIRRWSGGSNVVLDSNCTLTMEVVTGGGQTITTGGANVEIRGICRSVTITLGTSTSETVQINAVTGPVTISGSPTAATVDVYGVSSTVTASLSGATINNYSVSQATVNAQADTALSDALTVATTIDGKTFAEAIQIAAAMVGGKVSGAGTGTETFKGLDGSTTRATVTVDSSGNRTGVTY